MAKAENITSYRLLKSKEGRIILYTNASVSFFRPDDLIDCEDDIIYIMFVYIQQ